MVEQPIGSGVGVGTRRQPEPVAPRPKQEETFDIIGGHHDLESVTAEVADVVLKDKLRIGWLIFLAAALGGAATLLVAVLQVVLRGVGVWGNNQPVGWAFDIINFVWWIGIGHAGTLISAILLLVHQQWRTSINRFAEAMTIFAVVCAGIYPAMHIGRHQYFYWLIPLPNTMGMWPEFRSPLDWDFFAVSTYMTVSILFWFVGLIPDLATLRDRATNRYLKIIYGILSLGWRGSALHWHRYMALYMILAGISTPLVLSVHSTISYDFAVGIVPGWHATIFPPYFVAGAVFAGFAMVLLLGIPMRAVFGLRDLITMRHLENCGKVMLATGLIVVYGYFMEVFTAWYSGNIYEQFLALNRAFGPMGWSYWALIFCNAVVPQILWWKPARTNHIMLIVVSVIVSIGMWLERFVIIAVSLTRDFLPSSWGSYVPTRWDIAFYAGTFGLFLTLFLLFLRTLPAIAISEVRELVHHENHHGSHGHGDAHHGDSSHPKRGNVEPEASTFASA